MLLIILDYSSFSFSFLILWSLKFPHQNKWINEYLNNFITVTLPTLLSTPFQTEQIRGEKFLSTCALEALEIGFFTDKSSNIDDMAELKKRIVLDRTQKNSIGCKTKEEKELLSSLFIDYPIHVLANYSDIIPDEGTIAGFAYVKVFFLFFLSFLFSFLSSLFFSFSCSFFYWHLFILVQNQS